MYNADMLPCQNLFELRWTMYCHFFMKFYLRRISGQKQRVFPKNKKSQDKGDSVCSSDIENGRNSNSYSETDIYSYDDETKDDDGVESEIIPKVNYILMGFNKWCAPDVRVSQD